MRDRRRRTGSKVSHATVGRREAVRTRGQRRYWKRCSSVAQSSRANRIGAVFERHCAARRRGRTGHLADRCSERGGLTKTGGIDRTGQRRRSVLDDHQRARGACCSRLTTAALTRRNRKWVRSGGRRRSGRDCQASGSSRTS